MSAADPQPHLTPEELDILAPLTKGQAEMAYKDLQSSSCRHEPPPP